MKGQVLSREPHSQKKENDGVYGEKTEGGLKVGKKPLSTIKEEERHLLVLIKGRKTATCLWRRDRLNKGRIILIPGGISDPMFFGWRSRRFLA